MANLLLDSSRVEIYNKMSLGRTDVRNVECSREGWIAKIVKNIVQPPLTSKKMESVTFMHSRPLDNNNYGYRKFKEGTHLVLSRAITLPPHRISNNEEEYRKSEILLGVNLLEPCGKNSSKMISVTHVYFPILPTLVAKCVSIKLAINFVNDI